MSQPAAAPSRPNILVFMTDDHGHWAMHRAGTRELHTPTMDAIGRRGALMQHCFTPCPVCSPARASFWTGKIPSAHGIHDWIQEMGGGESHPGLAEQTNLGQRLQRAGYRTAMVGKWHCQRSWQVQPGFDFWYSICRGTDARFDNQRFNDNGTTVEQFGHQAPHLTDAAMRFLRQPRREPGEPWFLFVGYTNTHSPFSGEPERLAAHYRQCAFTDPPIEAQSPCHGQKKILIEEEDESEGRAQYYAAVNMIDEQMGRLLDELESRGELDNTLIVYTSDHGHMNGQHGLWGKGNATTPQNFLEESIHVPCVLSWPAAFDGNQRPTVPVDHCDLHATVLHAAGIADNDAELSMSPGRSYLPLLRGEMDASQWRDAQCCEYGNARMIRAGGHKLVRRYPGPNGRFQDELYDLDADPRETRNRIDDPAYAETVAHLSQQLDDYFARYEIADVRGLRMAELARLNVDEPWRRELHEAARALLTSSS